MRIILTILVIVFSGIRIGRGDLGEIFFDPPLFISTDVLAPRDEWGKLHQTRVLYDVDFAPRYDARAFYYFKAGEQLTLQPAYVGALQRVLTRLGYYCGAIDGKFSPEVSEAIARLQKNYSMPVTGTVTESVRRALNLP